MSGPRLLTLITVVIAAMCAAIVLVIGPSQDAAHAVVRGTARTSLVLFALAYVARLVGIIAIAWPDPAAAWIRGRRRFRPNTTGWSPRTYRRPRAETTVLCAP